MADPLWDVFVSYAHADDVPPLETATGWVTTLAGELRKMLRHKLGVSDVRIFMDHRLAANEGVTEALLDAVRRSRTLLLRNVARLPEVEMVPVGAGSISRSAD